ncbi:3669_t:CDS:10 [Ambispora gerdemannii]|uniref:DNA repair protein RAD51 homolog 3 n=1 Tax=Ambispora gerdemannii TaxID=144530 RepID=A0A9N8WPA2_9GLOM|nr:3669_t:CDS:10 [Ambispora gerdemannii]
MSDEHEAAGGLDDELSLPKEFIHLIASEANEICEKESKKTIAAEHVISALQALGFENYLSEVQEVFKEHKKLQKDRDKKSSRLENSGMTEEELLRQQELLFEQSPGYQTVKDLKETTPIELSKELEISTEEALDILQHCQKSHTIVRSVSASEALQRDLDRCPIFTSCEAIDKLFGGHGVPIGKITEFCGAPGIGKTQLGIQLSINVQIPKNLSGPGGEAIYIDTEGSFIAQRAQEIATATVQSLSEKSTEPLIDVETILSRIHYFRIHDYIELLAVVKILDDYLKEHSNVKLVVIDSIAFHFRQNFSDMALRTRLLNGLAQDLTKLVDSFELAVVILNQMTTKFGVNSGTILTDKPVLVPALGESWSHQCNNRVILYWRDDIRYAHLVKSSNLQEGTVPYKITSQGVRDVLEPEYVPHEESHESINRKRMREQFQGEEQELSKRHLVETE